MINIYLLTLYK